MNRRESAKEAKKQSEIAAIECELRLIAIGAHGCTNVEDDPDNGFFLWSTVGAEAFASYLSAVKSYWKIGLEYKDERGDTYKRCAWLMEPLSLAKWQSLEGGAKALYDAGAREGGEWID
jgi:hypothetical protein